MKAISRISQTLWGRARGRAIIAALAGAVVAVTMFLLPASPASAHCDAVDGPVATAARSAIEANDVKLVLPYVKAEQEAELTAAFKQTMAIRQRGADVRELTDHYFLETAVRLHRVGEGASYTGLKEAAPLDPALEAAETSLEQGTPDEVVGVLDNALRTKVAERYQGVLDARAAEKANPNVETARERVEAELMFEKYVLEISDAINAAASHEEAATGGETGHGH